MAGSISSLVNDAHLSDAVLSATLEADAWMPLVEMLMAAFDGEVAGINSVDLSTGTIIAARHNGLTPKAEAEYYQHLVLNDPRIPLVTGARVGSAVTDAALVAEPQIRKSAYYAWEADQAFAHTLCMKLVHTPDEISSIAIARSRGQGGHSDDVLATASALAPRLVIAAEINRRITALEGFNHGLNRAMAAGATAFALFGTGGRLLQANPAFQAALDRRDGLGRQSLALTVRAVEAEGEPRALQVRRRGTATPYRLMLQPLSHRAAEARNFDWGRRGAVLAFLDDPDATQGNRAPVLQQLFGLTAAEARVAVLIADGEEVEAIARRQGVAVTTVRSQLKSIFAKLGVSRQLGVARLVRGLPQFDG